MRTRARRGGASAYTARFFSEKHADVRRSAEVVVPWVVSLLQPRSVIDVGCGTGTWLSIFRQQGVATVFGLDGDWIREDQLDIPAECLRRADLQAPPEVGRTFDLAVSTEVAEHLPASAAPGFISYLTGCAPVVLFSAGIPRQGGTGHINEQWPGYWIRLFQDCGYKVIDCVRGRLWADTVVAPWYAQNLFFFVRDDRANDFPALGESEKRFSMGGKPVVHPRQFLLRIEELSDPRNYSLKRVLKVLPYLVVRGIHGKLFRR